MKEKKTKKGGLSDYSGAIYLDDIKRVEDGKKKDKKSEDKE